MEVRPDYYDNFECIAGKCAHNCCIGWEIDIDSRTLKKYKSESGGLREKLQKNIALEPCAHFILAENERCPFLNKQNLCELILLRGEDMLCQICTDHPRFYNEVYGITEKGIGLCCEEAARIILTNKTPVKLIADDGKVPQNDFFNERNEIFNILQNREMPLKTRIAAILERANVLLPINEIDWVKIYKSLERLDPEWDKYLDSVACISDDIPEELEISCEQLIHYFIYRHLSGAVEDFLFGERVQFAVLSCYVIASLNKTKSAEEFLEIARTYSSEIEYSDENIDVLLETLQEYNKNNDK